MTISMIVAMDNEGKIGLNNRLLCKLPNDLQWFRRVTEGHTVIMGRKTYESIGKPLPKRQNIVLTKNGYHYRQNDPYAYNCHFGNLYSALDHISTIEDEVFIIGGGVVYEEFLSRADKLYITHINHTFTGEGEWARFPEIAHDEWKITWAKQNYKDEQNPYDHRFVIYERSNKSDK